MGKLSTLVSCLLLSLFVTAQDKITDSTSIPEPKVFVSNHQITNGGKLIKYKAVASETYLKNKSGEPVASLWSVAYVQTGTTDTTKRPVTFVFNGGPGSASMWLQMGMFGPKLVKVDSDATKDDGAAPYTILPIWYSSIPWEPGTARLSGKARSKTFGDSPKTPIPWPSLCDNG